MRRALINQVLKDTVDVYPPPIFQKYYFNLINEKFGDMMWNYLQVM